MKRERSEIPTENKKVVIKLAKTKQKLLSQINKFNLHPKIEITEFVGKEGANE